MNKVHSGKWRTMGVVEAAARQKSCFISQPMSEVMMAMQEGLRGRAETAYGLTDTFAMKGVACGQGHECSPTRAKLMMAFYQLLVMRLFEM